MTPESIVLGIIAIIGCIIGVLSYINNGNAMVKKQSEEWGQLKSDIGHIKDNINDVKTTLVDTKQTHKESLDRVYIRLDERFAEHERVFHNIKREETGE